MNLGSNLPKVKELQWDSEFFGFRVACLRNCNDTRSARSLIYQALQSGIKLVYLSVDIDNAKNLASFKTAFASRHVVDHLKYRYRIPSAAQSPIGDLPSRWAVHRYAQGNADESLVKLALQAGSRSRFNVDAKFGKVVFEKLYETWIHRSCRREIADTVEVIEDESGEAVGLVTLRVAGNCCSIGLIAVSPEYHGRGLGKLLIDRVICYATQHGCKEVSVVTQAENSPAIHLYESCGFVCCEKNAWFHFWNEVER